MLNSLTFTISFPSTGKAFSQSITFKPGLTIIRGANETGKSLILEMIRYALFGVAALRSDRSDYDVLDVDLSFSTKGNDYRVIRKGNKATLGTTTGTAAVNKEILNLLGFDLDVFDIACAAVQGDLDKLTKRMRPGERRKMVEEVIGLSTIEKEEKACRDDGNAHTRMADMMEKKLVSPEPPETPTDYESSDILEQLYHDQLRLEAERAQLLRMREPVKPVEPVRPLFDDDVEDHEKKRLEIESERLGIERTLRRIPAVTRTREDIDRARTYYEQQKLGPRPRYSRDDIDKWLKDWETLRAIGELVQCPNCGIEFDPSTATVHSLPAEPPLSYSECKAEVIADERWSSYSGVVIESTDITEQELKDQEYAISQESYREELLASLALLPDLDNRSEEAERKRVFERDYEVWKALDANYQTALADYMDAQRRLADIPEVVSGLDIKLKNSRQYEEQKRRYDADKAAYDEDVASITQQRELADGYYKGAEALKEVRLKVKQHLVPSLNKVASHLLSEMTDGARNQIIVDEDFEVTVDGQPVRTLSGSGMSVVNLALRIALGQVLTQSVVPIFLADEIDHDMDEERAKATHESLRKLTNTLDKVIVVTHKNIQGDHIISL